MGGPPDSWLGRITLKPDFVSESVHGPLEGTETEAKQGRTWQKHINHRVQTQGTESDVLSAFAT